MAAVTEPGGTGHVHGRGRTERRARALSPGWWVTAGWAAQVLVRLMLYRGHSGPEIMPDEAGYLIAVRRLLGGPGADLSGFSLYQGGYALVLIPARLIGGGPEGVYRLVMVTNALIGALAFPLGRLALLRCGVPRERALPLAWAAALLPAATVYGGEALADAVLPVTVLGWLLALDRFVGRGTVPAAVTASGLACFAFAAHPRGAVVLAVHGAVLVLRLARGPARRAASAALSVTAGCAVAAWSFNAWLSTALYPYGSRDLSGILHTRVTTFGGQFWAWSGAAGQLWAMAAGTWGLGALGVVVTVVAVTRRGVGVWRADRLMATVLLVTTLGIAYASSAALPDEHRVGNFAYGRYLSCVALSFALIGLGRLSRARPTSDRPANDDPAVRSRLRTGRCVAGAVALLAGTGYWVVAYAGERLRTSWYYGQDFPEVGLLGGGYGELRPGVTTAVACALLLGWWALARWGAVKLFAALLAVDLAASWLIVYTRHLGLSSTAPPMPIQAGDVAMERQVPGVDRPLVEDVRPIRALIRARVAYRVWWTGLVPFDRDRGLPGPGFCAAVVYRPDGAADETTWPGHPGGWRFQSVEDGVLQWVVWYDPACRNGPWGRHRPGP